MLAFCVKNSITHPLALAASMYLQCQVGSRGMQITQRHVVRGARCAVTQTGATHGAKGHARLAARELLSARAKYITDIWLCKR